ncbi:phosphoribosylaminoimidazolesuccinocarboxamide synthase [Chitinivibrio alkaliphilus]|uniref:Phosphoribosylaminoimidazole-succinocarboxamide synthase n=1 Tax=Chitinivibrio alkaliphilus ACht1 TaxID=1313304 RepID=U7DB30_9BACT|nr:phosphoribosylaminoimidazolesuccinocarboxamide synthase [Chitinivibrio alkaliphilus]ERP39237.1 phosphoribosylaminoimidazole-succinocarboxamide synthase [Chitinivibrio alkaliphilus ACht1]
MTAYTVLENSHTLPIRTHQPVHRGKVRSVYWLTPEDSHRLISEKNYPVSPDSSLGIMVISDRISAFECLWKAEKGMNGVPGKGAALNAIANHWFRRFRDRGLADSHILDTPHPLVWIVQRAEPVMIEAIARNYITGSMWRAYVRGERNFCGIKLPDGLEKNQKLSKTLITPSTKGILRGIPGVPEADDVNISHGDIMANYEAFKFHSKEDVARYEELLCQGVDLISNELARAGQIFVDTKFEFGYAEDMHGTKRLIYMDEVGTPDSSRMWDAREYQQGHIVENSKEEFRTYLLENIPDPDILTQKERMDERVKIAEELRLPREVFLKVSGTYRSMAETITGQSIPIPAAPREEIISILKSSYGVIDE